MAFKEMTGFVFGKLTVIDRGPNGKDGTIRWNVVCECGEKRLVAGTGLRAKRHKSCGCSSPRFKSETVSTHGMTMTRIYRIWAGMKKRCSDTSTQKSRRLYYDKGIRVCERWLVFENFLEDMGIPMAHQSIDRINGNKGYEKDNCRWADRKTQANNTSANLVITLDGVSKTASEWADATGIKANTIVYRVRRGWSPERALKKNPMHIGTKKKLDRTRPCPICGNPFIPRPNQLRAGVGKYCSQKCNGQSRKKTELSCLNDTIEQLMNGKA